MIKISLFNLKNKVALVTGGATGIGKAICSVLKESGADVVSTYHKNKPEDDSITYLKCDVQKKSHVIKTVRKVIKLYGKIDILVNNAGIFFPTPIDRIDEKAWHNILDTNLTAAMLFCREVSRYMKSRKSGSIINIASIAGLQAFSSSLAYNVSKSGLIMLTKTLANDLGKYNIRVNAIAPGVISTNMTKALLNNKNFVAMIKSTVPLRREGQPEEIAGAALYLASKASSYTTGQVFVIDGGWTCHL